MGKDKIRLPSSEGGIVRYSDTGYVSKFIWSPELVVGIVVSVIIALVVLNMLF